MQADEHEGVREQGAPLNLSVRKSELRDKPSSLVLSSLPSSDRTGLGSTAGNGEKIQPEKDQTAH
jgi:hypothetical protein